MVLPFAVMNQTRQSIYLCHRTGYSWENRLVNLIRLSICFVYLNLLLVRHTFINGALNCVERASSATVNFCLYFRARWQPSFVRNFFLLCLHISLWLWLVLIEMCYESAIVVQYQRRHFSTYFFVLVIFLFFSLCLNKCEVNDRMFKRLN